MTRAWRLPRWSWVALSAGLLVVAVIAALAELLPLVPVRPPPAPNYDDAAAWLCRPGRADACAPPVTTTIVAADGSSRTATDAADTAASIDCFYVYPTVSHASGDNAPIAATGDEIGAARQQLARFASVCRPFAPLYRQVTRAGLRAIIDNPDPDVASRAVAYEDVLAAWRSYLARDNAGRGVVLIGHSQGAKILARLIAAEIDGQPMEAKLVAAIIPGTRVDVPFARRAGQEAGPAVNESINNVVGGTFAHIPLCAGAAQVGCVIAYSSYPADAEIPAKPRFGTTPAPGMAYACVDPAKVLGTTTLDALLPVPTSLRPAVSTEFLDVSGLLTARCTENGSASVLAVAAHPANSAGAAAAALLKRVGDASPTWGLHGLDINLAEGTLVALVRRQTAAYLHH